VLAQQPGADTEYRAVFAAPSNEGINGDSSPAVRVSVTGCTAVVGVMAAAILAPCA
jgi:hypothetical protein